MFYYVYLLQSQKDKSFYIFRPYKLIFYEAFLDRIDAKNREVYLKSGYGRKTINGLLKKYLNQGDRERD